jgi:hypothetical protein
VGFVENDDQLVGRIGMKPGSRLSKDRPFDWPHQHIFKHRVVGNKHVWTAFLRFMTNHELAVAGLRMQAAIPMAETALPRGSHSDFFFVIGVKSCKVFRRPLTNGFQLPAQVVVAENAKIERLKERLDPFPVAGRCTGTRIGRSTCVTSKPNRSAPPVGDDFRSSHITKELSNSRELVIHKRVHGIKQYGPTSGQTRRRSTKRIFNRELPQNGHQKALRFS